jgi:hypothetical protein
MSLVLVVAAFALVVSVGWAGDDSKVERKPNYPAAPKSDNVSIMPTAWKTAPTSPLTPSELDHLLLAAQKEDQLKPAPRTTDEQFLRRVTLDLAGRLPTPKEIEVFVASKTPAKRAQVIDQLLASTEFNRTWARLWGDVVTARATEMRIRPFAAEFDAWLTAQMAANKNWGEIAHAIITARGALTDDSENKDRNGATYFLLVHSGPEAANERAADTARVFMGVQIQCAQCHDHPSDIWKRHHFHELAAFFARLKERPIRDAGKRQGIQLFSTPGGEHRMPDKDDPKKSYPTSPVFLTGTKPPSARSDGDRRQALADFMVSKDNYWFSAAFVNRTWGELMGQAFYEPVDNMGPLQNAHYPEILLRLAAHFRASNYDIRGLYRLIMNTDAYQRQARLGESPDQHLHFTGIYPARLPADALWEALDKALGSMAFPNRQLARQEGGPKNPIVRRGGFEGLFKQLFAVDPSAKADEVEGSVPQALMLMNNPQINARMKAGRGNMLAEVLDRNPTDDAAIRDLYLRVLARKPTQRELKVAKDHLQQARSRAEGFEDLLWVLVNSTEFLTKR